MSRHLRLRAALGAIILLAASLAPAQDSAKDKKDVKETTPDYYPLQAGNEWHYRHIVNGENSKVVMRIAKAKESDDKKLARLERPDVKFSEDLFQNDKGVFRAQVNGAELTPPVQLIAYPAKPGKKWQGEYAIGKEKGSYTGEILKAETVKVPAGEFETIRVTIKIEQNGQQVETTYWFARDIGFVKETVEAAGSSITLELEKFERKK